MKNQPLTSERLRELLRYEPETGEFRWRVRRCAAVPAGAVAGCHAKKVGYWLIRVDRKQYWAHRLAFLYMTGEWPKNEVDHINGGKLDNRWSNLRDVPRSTNMQNRRTATSNSRSGYLGVRWSSREMRWNAIIKLNGKRHDLGYFDDPEAAHRTYLVAKRKLHAGCTI